MTVGGSRYAIYFAPDPESALARFGRQWLGYDAETGAPTLQPALATVPAERLIAITAEPRGYGFHATLKPPFVLAEGHDVAALAAAAAAFAATRAPFEASPLTLSCISGFWALTLSQRSAEIDRLAADCVAQFDGFRAAPSEAELAKRRLANLSPAQETLLQRWGYPYVMEEFRFHLTLSARLDPVAGETLRRELAPRVAPLCRTPLAVDAICLFHQSTAGAPFRVLRRFRFGG